MKIIEIDLTKTHSELRITALEGIKKILYSAL